MKFICLVAILLFCLPAFAENKVKLFLKWKIGFQFAGFFMAKEKGLYDMEGLQVEIIERDVNTNPESLVGNRLGSYGVSDSSVVRQYIQGGPNLIVAPIFQNTPLALVSLKSSNISAPKDLIGKKVMYMRGLEDAPISALLKKYSIKESDLELVPHSMDINDLINGKTDVISIYVNDLPDKIKGKKIGYSILGPRKFGVDFYGDILFTSKAEVLEYPNRVERFKKASLLGWRYAFNNIKETAMFLKYKFNLKKDLDELIKEGEVLKDYSRFGYIKLGKVNLPKLSRTANLYKNKATDIKYDIRNILYMNYYKKNKAVPQYIFITTGLLLIVLSGVIFSILYFNRRLKLEVEKQTQLLIEAEDFKNNLFRNLTHDLKTPLNGIESSLVLFLNTNDEQEKLDYINIASNSTKVLINLVDEILDFYMIENKKLVFFEDKVSFYDWINEQTVFYKVLCSEKKVKFSYKQVKSRLTYVCVDKVKFIRILNSIINYILKLSDQGEILLKIDEEDKDGKVHLFFEIDATKIFSEIKNTQQVFLPFQESESSIGNTGGIGLSLALSKMFLERYDGHIEQELNQEGYLRIKFDLLLTRLEASFVNDAIDSNLDSSLLDGINVLVVEDDIINAKLLTKYLEKFKATVAWAEDGVKGLDKFVNGHFGLVFIDRNMPKLSGIGLAKKIRSLDDPIKNSVLIVGFSANWKDGLDIECEAAQMNASLSKPVKLTVLKLTLQKLLLYRDKMVG